MVDEIGPPAKRRIAVVAHGGLTPFSDGRFVPVLIKLLDGLSSTFDLETFSFGNDGAVRDCAWRINKVPFVERVSRQVRRLARAVVDRHRQIPFDLIHGIWGFPGGAAAVRAAGQVGVPSVVTFNGFEPVSFPDIGYGGQLAWRSRRMLRDVAERADHLVFPSRYQADAWCSAHAKPASMSVIPYTIDEARFAMAPRAFHHPLRLLAVGSMNEVKDYPTLFKAFDLVRKVKAAQLRVVGDDYNECWSSGQLRLSPDVQLIGKVHHENIVEHYRWADIFLHASRHESQGVVFLEALAAGLPIVSTRVGLMSDWSTNVPTAPCGDDRALADLVLQVPATPEQRIPFWRGRWDSWRGSLTYADVYQRCIQGEM